MDLSPSTQPPQDPVASSYFAWEPQGKQIAVHLRAEAVDQIGIAVMLGFGALRKRGAEVGGLLLGSIEHGGKTVVRVEEFREVPCTHLHGPSYILSQNDMPALDGALTAHSRASGSRLRVVGFVRSHTREPIQLGQADLDLLDARFPGGDAICLLVKPFPTRPSEAVLLVREDGAFPSAVQAETFVFRRKEMRLPPAPKRERAPASMPQQPAKPASDEVATPAELDTPELEAAPESNLDRMGRRRFSRAIPSFPAAYDESQSQPASDGLADAPPDTRYAPVRRYRWVWLSLLLLLLGAFIGAALTLTLNVSETQTLRRNPYSLGLSVSRIGENSQLKWNPESPAVLHARGGELLIEEGAASKTQQLSAGDLARGGLLYRGALAPVRFRLTLHMPDRAALSETVETEPEGQSEAK